MLVYKYMGLNNIMPGLASNFNENHNSELVEEIDFSRLFNDRRGRISGGRLRAGTSGGMDGTAVEVDSLLLILSLLGGTSG